MKLLDTLLSVAAPFDCVGCGTEGAVACEACIATVPIIPSRCYRCYAATTDYSVCDACKRYTSLRHVWTAATYEGIVKELIRVYKFERVLSAYRPIAALTSYALPMVDDVVIAAVPTATSHRRKRGYDHALLLAKELAHRLKVVQVTPAVKLSQSRQVGASRKERYEQLKGGFMIHRPELVAGKKVLLVDDVITSGATIETLAKLLKKAGAKEVNGVVCAQQL